jgi:TfoX/Sxy family transcriptional regulator of competence genes
MAYDDGVAQRVREALIDQSDVVEKKMFGGLAFMVRGHMCCGVVGGELMLRIGPEGYDSALSQPHARQMDFTGKPMKGFVYVAPTGFEDDGDLQSWVDRALSFVTTLPAK